MELSVFLQVYINNYIFESLSCSTVLTSILKIVGLILKKREKNPTLNVKLIKNKSCCPSPPFNLLLLHSFSNLVRIANNSFVSILCLFLPY